MVKYAAKNLQNFSSQLAARACCSKQKEAIQFRPNAPRSRVRIYRNKYKNIFFFLYKNIWKIQKPAVTLVWARIDLLLQVN